jgi:hypothetical protein
VQKLAIYLAVISVLQLQGCAQLMEELKRDPRDAAWDPKPGQRLMDQLPAWDQDVCGRFKGRAPGCERKVVGG